ncbi:6-phosphogluconate dehydrogenase [Pancytospora philotis]|nr:6-phosphogluconate dehydrogenase [Pancytospora philotis]
MADVGIVGLGVMGSNLALNFAGKGIKVHAYNRTQSKVEDLVGECGDITGHSTLEGMAKALSRPRRIVLMVSAGGAVDKFLAALDGVLDADDVVIDGGNSDYKDTIRRGREHRYRIAGCGISGGEDGARHGPSIMVGCDRAVYDVIGPVLEKISACAGGNPCCGWMGEDGAGHFVKAIHNGIEYCEMALLQEAFNIVCRGPTGSEIERAAAMLDAWDAGSSGGYLVEICAKILRKRGSEGYVIEDIVDRAEQKGTGKMCVVASMEAGEDATMIAEAVMSRFLSSKKDKRVAFSALTTDDPARADKDNAEGLEEDLHCAFYLCKIVSYVQGFNLLRAKGREHSWGLRLGKICDVWMNGCILRSKALGVVKQIVEGGEEHFEQSSVFQQILRDGRAALRRVCAHAVVNGIHAPVFTGCLMWLHGLEMSANNGTLIQAMRDYFGRHGVLLKDGRNTNIDWE